jgi:hypothetical protein
MRAMVARTSDNCCVRFEGRGKSDEKRKKLEVLLILLFIMLVMMVIWSVVITSIKSGGHGKKD